MNNTFLVRNISCSALLILVVAFGLSISTTSSAEVPSKTSHVNKDGSIKLSFEIVDGYKIKIWIDTVKKQRAYEETFMADMNTITVDYLDVNGDGLEDLLVKHEDETGYSPQLYINQNGTKFTKVMKRAPYISTETMFDDDGSGSAAIGYKI